MVISVKAGNTEGESVKQKNPLRVLTSLFVFVILLWGNCFSQSAWPAVEWNNAVNLSAILSSSAEELSGLYWNNSSMRLMAVSDQGELFVLQMNAVSGQFSLLNTSTKVKNTEAITQVNELANEFYIINEADYEIQKFAHNSNFSTVTKLNSWNMLLPKSTMTKTDNNGPEGIAFVPDSYLTKIGFVSAVTGQKYTSVKGMKGLLFIAHQDNGYVWVFDVNPVVNDDYIFVGKYRTSRSESCELAFDNSTGLMYVLHNIDDNYLEITDLTAVYQFGEYYFKTQKEFLLTNPSGSNNIEGLTLSPKFPVESYHGLWLCRDVTKSEEKSSSLTWYNNFPAEGESLKTGFPATEDDLLNVSQLPNAWIIDGGDIGYPCIIKVFNMQGTLIYNAENALLPVSIDTGNYPAGIYFLQIDNQQHTDTKYRKVCKH